MIAWAGRPKKQALWRVSLDNEKQEQEFCIAPLFATPICETKLDLDVDPLVKIADKFEYERMEVGNGWYSSDKYALDKPEFTELKTKIMDSVNYFIFNFLNVKKDYEFYMTNSWIVKHDVGDWGQSHIHTNSLFSGVYYLHTNENSGKIVFRKAPTNTNIFPLACDLEFSDWNIYNSKVWTYWPFNNQLLIFPSHMFHSIEKNESDEIRYSIAFNTFVRGKIGSKEFELELK